MVEALFNAYFTDGRNLSDRAALEAARDRVGPRRDPRPAVGEGGALAEVVEVGQEPFAAGAGLTAARDQPGVAGELAQVAAYDKHMTGHGCLLRVVGFSYRVSFAHAGGRTVERLVADRPAGVVRHRECIRAGA